MNRASLSHERSSWVVIEIWRQPPLGVGEAHALALGPVLDLIAVDFADGEVLGFGVSEIQAAPGTGRPHGAALGQLDAGVILPLQQLPQQQLLLLNVQQTHFVLHSFHLDHLVVELNELHQK